MLTERLQIQALADRLAGLPTHVFARSFGEPWRGLWHALDKLGGEASTSDKVEAITNALMGNADRDEILKRLLQVRPGFRNHYPNLGELAEHLLPIQWLWEGWLPRGMMTLLGASPGVGKSFLGMDIAWRVIDYGFWPDGSPVPNSPANVIYVDAEAVPQIINERAGFYGVNRDKLYLMLPDDGEAIDFGDLKYRERLVEMVWNLRPELIIIDSLSSIHSKGQNNVEDVREVLGFLSQLASGHNLGLVLVHHIRKPGGGAQMQLFDIDLSDLSGSGHIVAMARVVWGLHIVQTGPKEDKNGPRELKMLKTNLGGYEDPLGFEFVKGVNGGVLLRWMEEPPQSYRAPTERDDCKEWLLDILAHGPMTPRDVVELGKDAGFGRSTIYRARRELEGEIENTEGRKSTNNEWQLAGWVDPSDGEDDENEV